MHLLALFLSLSASASPQFACDKIYQAFTACDANIRFNGDVFDFFNGRDRVEMKCNDGRALSFYDRIESMDVASMLSIPYITGNTPLPEMRRNWDPGRLRAEPLLKAIFGNNAASVRANLVSVNFLGQSVKFQKQLGAAAALERVGQELQRESLKDPALADFLHPFTSKKVDLREYGFFWRFVKGTKRLSTHSFGTAIDLLLDNNGPQYWLWDEAAKNPTKAKQGEVAYRNDHYIPGAAPRFHAKAVAIFERNGFIWGGKWNHYDTMHFEYRPEILATKIDCGRFPGVLVQLDSDPLAQTSEKKVSDAYNSSLNGTH